MISNKGILYELGEQVEDLGHKPGTPAYNRELRKLKVFKCQDLKGLNECAACRVNESCELSREYRMDLRFPDR
jgi:hypothetical protein